MHTPKATARLRHLRSAKPFHALSPARQLPDISSEWGGSRTNYIYILWSAKVLILLFVVAGALIGYWWSSNQRPMYKARIALEVQEFNSDFLNLRDVSPILPSGSYEAGVQAQVRTFQSNALLRRTLRKLMPDRDTKRGSPSGSSGPSGNPWYAALAIAAGTTSARALANTRVIEVSCDSTEPQAAAEFLNALADEHVAYSIESRFAAAKRTGDWLNEQLAELKTKLQASEQRLQAYVRSNNLVITSPTDAPGGEALRQLNQELLRAQAATLEKRSKYENISGASPDLIPDVVADSALREYTSKITDLRRQLVELKSTFTPAHIRVKRVEAQIEELEDARSRQRENVLGRIHQEYKEAVRLETLLSAAYAQQTHKVSAQSEKAIAYNILRQEVDSTRQLYDAMLQRVREAHIAAALRSSNVSVIEPAEPPAAPYKPRPRSTAMLGSFMGALGAGALVWVRSLSRRTIAVPGEAAVILNTHELGVIPTARNQLLTAANLLQPMSDSRRGLVGTNGANGTSHAQSITRRGAVELATCNQKDSVIADSFRATLVSLLLSGPGGFPPRIVVLTSPGPGDGKTTVVSNLGIAMAEIDKRVLLIEADVRKPRLRKIFGLESSAGLIDILDNPAPIEQLAIQDYIVPTPVSGLHLMPCGRSHKAAWNLFSKRRLHDMLETLRHEFDLVLIDTSPLLVGPDARLVARLADGVVMVLRAGESCLDAANAVNHRLSEDGTPVLGIVLNNWHPIINTYSYGYSRY